MSEVRVNRVRRETNKLEEMIINVFNDDFTENKFKVASCENLSQEDKLWKTKVENSV